MKIEAVDPVPLPHRLSTLPKGDQHRHVWTELVPRLINPVQLLIINALLESGRPLSAIELEQRLEDPELYRSRLGYHLKRLEEGGVLERVERRQGPGTTEEFRFFFPAAKAAAASSRSAAGERPG